ncbi:dual specificity protein phosphatase 19-like protein [Dinothrombium tinctorium]|nr:dual specificity protein phosphatase 19-like protein [Dinothrombium tinctorium]
MDLFSELKHFGQAKLNKVQTVVKTQSGKLFVERRNDDGSVVCSSEKAERCEGFVIDTKPDLNIGFVMKGVLIGSQDVAHNFDLLVDNSITHILNVAVGVSNEFEDKFIYRNVPILDVPEFELKQCLKLCFDFIDDCRNKYGICLVHCNAGVSRAPIVAIAYLMFKTEITYEEALNRIKSTRSCINPNPGFVRQLEIFEPYFLKRDLSILD